MTDLQQIAFVMLATVGVACLAATVLLLSWMSVKLMEFSAEMFSWSPVSGS